MLTIDPESRKRLRGIGHALHPVVTIAANGLSEAVGAELERALREHELIKVKLAISDRELRRQLTRRIVADFNATIVQEIGKIVLIYRHNPHPDPRLTNVATNI